MEKSKKGFVNENNMLAYLSQLSSAHYDLAKMINQSSESRRQDATKIALTCVDSGYLSDAKETGDLQSHLLTLHELLAGFVTSLAETSDDDVPSGRLRSLKQQYLLVTNQLRRLLDRTQLAEDRRCVEVLLPRTDVVCWMEQMRRLIDDLKEYKTDKGFEVDELSTQAEPSEWDRSRSSLYGDEAKWRTEGAAADYGDTTPSNRSNDADERRGSPSKKPRGIAKRLVDSPSTRSKTAGALRSEDEDSSSCQNESLFSKCMDDNIGFQTDAAEKCSHARLPSYYESDVDENREASFPLKVESKPCQIRFDETRNTRMTENCVKSCDSYDERTSVSTVEITLQPGEKCMSGSMQDCWFLELGTGINKRMEDSKPIMDRLGVTRDKRELDDGRGERNCQGSVIVDALHNKRYRLIPFSDCKSQSSSKENVTTTDERMLNEEVFESVYTSSDDEVDRDTVKGPNEKMKVQNYLGMIHPAQAPASVYSTDSSVMLNGTLKRRRNVTVQSDSQLSSRKASGSSPERQMTTNASQNCFIDSKTSSVGEAKALEHSQDFDASRQSIYENGRCKRKSQIAREDVDKKVLLWQNAREQVEESYTTKQVGNEKTVESVENKLLSSNNSARSWSCSTDKRSAVNADEYLMRNPDEGVESSLPKSEQSCSGDVSKMKCRTPSKRYFPYNDQRKCILHQTYRSCSAVGKEQLAATLLELISLEKLNSIIVSNRNEGNFRFQLNPSSVEVKPQTSGLSQNACMIANLGQSGSFVECCNFAAKSSDSISGTSVRGFEARGHDCTWEHTISQINSMNQPEMVTAKPWHSKTRCIDERTNSFSYSDDCTQTVSSHESLDGRKWILQCCNEMPNKRSDLHSCCNDAQGAVYCLEKHETCRVKSLQLETITEHCPCTNDSTVHGSFRTMSVSSRNENGFPTEATRDTVSLVERNRSSRAPQKKQNLKFFLQDNIEAPSQENMRTRMLNNSLKCNSVPPYTPSLFMYEGNGKNNITALSTNRVSCPEYSTINRGMNFSSPHLTTATNYIHSHEAINRNTRVTPCSAEVTMSRPGNRGGGYYFSHNRDQVQAFDNIIPLRQQQPTAALISTRLENHSQPHMHCYPVWKGMTSRLFGTEDIKRENGANLFKNMVSFVTSPQMVEGTNYSRNKALRFYHEKVHSEKGNDIAINVMRSPCLDGEKLETVKFDDHVESNEPNILLITSKNVSNSQNIDANNSDTHKKYANYYERNRVRQEGYLTINDLFESVSEEYPTRIIPVCKRIDNYETRHILDYFEIQSTSSQIDSTFKIKKPNVSKVKARHSEGSLGMNSYVYQGFSRKDANLLQDKSDKFSETGRIRLDLPTEQHCNPIPDGRIFTNNRSSLTEYPIIPGNETRCNQTQGNDQFCQRDATLKNTLDRSRKIGDYWFNDCGAGTRANRRTLDSNDFSNSSIRDVRYNGSGECKCQPFKNNKYISKDVTQATRISKGEVYSGTVGGHGDHVLQVQYNEQRKKNDSSKTRANRRDTSYNARESKHWMEAETDRGLKDQACRSDAIPSTGLQENGDRGQILFNYMAKASRKAKNHASARRTKPEKDSRKGNVGFDVFGRPLHDLKGRPLFDQYGRPLYDLFTWPIYDNQGRPVMDASGNILTDELGRPTSSPPGKPLIKGLSRLFNREARDLISSPTDTGRPFTDANGHPLEDFLGGPLFDKAGMPLYNRHGLPIMDRYGHPLYDSEGKPLCDRSGRPLTKVPGVPHFELDAPQERNDRFYVATPRDTRCNAGIGPDEQGDFLKTVGS